MNLSRDRKNEVKELVKSESNFDLKKISPVEVLNLVFGEYAPNTQRAYARAFKNLQDWADIKNIDEKRFYELLVTVLSRRFAEHRSV